MTIYIIIIFLIKKMFLVGSDLEISAHLTLLEVENQRRHRSSRGRGSGQEQSRMVSICRRSNCQYRRHLVVVDFWVIPLIQLQCNDFVWEKRLVAKYEIGLLSTILLKLISLSFKYTFGKLTIRKKSSYRAFQKEQNSKKQTISKSYNWKINYVPWNTMVWYCYK